MPLTPALAEIIWTKRFWAEYFSLEPEDDSPWNPSGTALVTIPVGSGYTLTLEFRLSSPGDLTLKYISPSDPNSISLLARSGFCGSPHLLRWSELPLISRAAAVLDPEGFSHPYQVLLLLVRFAPICVDDDVDAIAGMVHGVLSQMGFQYKEISLALRSLDYRSADFRWRYDEVVEGWVPQQYRWHTTGKWLATLRSTDNADFPFETWPGLLAAAEETARSSETKKDDQSVAVPKYRLSVQHTQYLKVPVGTKPYPLFSKADTHLARVLSRLLQDLEMGNSRCCFSDQVHLDDGSLVERSFQLELTVFGDLGQCQRVLRDALLWFGAPAETLMHDLRGSRKSEKYLLREQADGDDDTYTPHTHIVLGKLGALYKRNGVPAEQAMQQNLCSKLIQSRLDQAGAHTYPGHISVLETQDGGDIRFLLAETPERQREDLVTVALYRVTPQVAKFLYRLLVDGGLVLFPALIAAKDDVVDKLRMERGEEEGCPYPPIEVIGCEEGLLRILEAGPYQWWSKKGMQAEMST
ncbi:hypothetical protein BJX63DRAFT_207247 [Aspergillus granulosus]|uniref:Uncharacterized protein n=1 Tax=Aspergillus granulosus TaxID=176169 RepID=A0ABR4HEV3_9EURO